MAIKDLLVAFDDSEGARNAARLGAQMATKYGAKLTGAFAYEPKSYDGGGVQRWIPKDVLERMHEGEVQAAEAIETSFRTIVAETGYAGSLDWLTLEGQPYVLLPRITRYFDITLFGQFYEQAETKGAPLPPTTVLLRAGKPILVVPRAYEVRPFKEYGVVAWDGSRSAARALTDAMQILETKQRLDVVHFDEDRAGWSLPSKEHTIVDHIARHGIAANDVPLDKGRGMGATLIDYVRQNDPDILVMGAYGRGKFGSVVFGSLTKYVLEHMTTPVLLSH